MKKTKWILFAAVALLGLGTLAGSDWKERAQKGEKREIPPAANWGPALGENLKVTVWDANKADDQPLTLTTSREAFGFGVAMGGKKGGFGIGLGGRLIPLKGGGYEVLLAMQAGGGKDKGAMGMELQSSVIVKKGQAAVFCDSKDMKLMVKVESAG
jgi:hypothetical protein